MTELERALLELELEWPETPDLAGAVLTRIEAETAGDAGPIEAGREDARAAPRRPFFAGWRRRVAVAVAALAVLGGGTLAVSPAARSTVSRWLGLKGVEIRREKPTATPPPRSRLGETLGLGVPITPAQARKAGALFPGDLPSPDAAYLGPLVGGQRPVALVYAPRDGLRPSKVTGVALIVQTFKASLDSVILKKMATNVVYLMVGGAPAYWISGEPHGFQYATPNGAGAFVPQRLADHTLILERPDGRLVRIEGVLTRAAAVKLAESVH
jgi:hypothetical protein